MRKAKARQLCMLPSTPREVREQARLTQAQMAPLMGMSLSGYRKWEQGTRRVSGPAATLLRVIQKGARGRQTRPVVLVSGRPGFGLLRSPDPCPAAGSPHLRALTCRHRAAGIAKPGERHDTIREAQGTTGRHQPYRARSRRHPGGARFLPRLPRFRGFLREREGGLHLFRRPVHQFHDRPAPRARTKAAISASPWTTSRSPSSG